MWLVNHCFNHKAPYSVSFGLNMVVLVGYTEPPHLKQWENDRQRWLYRWVNLNQQVQHQVVGDV